MTILYFLVLPSKINETCHYQFTTRLQEGFIKMRIEDYSCDKTYRLVPQNGMHFRFSLFEQNEEEVEKPESSVCQVVATIQQMNGKIQIVCRDQGAAMKVVYISEVNQEVVITVWAPYREDQADILLYFEGITA